MRDNLLIVGAAMILLSVAVMLSTITRRDPPNAPQITPKSLTADPEFWAGQEIRLRTAGMELADGQLAYRTHTDRPPAIVCQFDAECPDPLPEWITGVCAGVQGDSIIVVSCR
jgi:hypothetical protein